MRAFSRSELLHPGAAMARQPAARRRGIARDVEATLPDRDPVRADGPVLRGRSAHAGEDPMCVGEDASLDRLRELLLDRRMPGVPVVDCERRPIGIVTRTDLLAVAEREERPGPAVAERAGPADGAGGDGVPSPAPLTAADVMTAMVFALPASASLEQVAALMAYEGIQQVVITDDSGKVVGLVSSLDIARWCAQTAGYLV